MNDTKPVPSRLWSTIQDLQELRNHEDVGPSRERRIKSAISDLDQVRISIKSEDSDDE